VKNYFRLGSNRLEAEEGWKKLSFQNPGGEMPISTFHENLELHCINNSIVGSKGSIFLEKWYKNGTIYTKSIIVFI
jgi:hypothetical protein